MPGAFRRFRGISLLAVLTVSTICAVPALAQIKVQPLYPENNDIISGTYVLMVYSDNAGNPAAIDSMHYQVTSGTDSVIIAFGTSTRMTKVDHDTIGLWVSTFNSNTATTPDGSYKLVFRAHDGGTTKDTSIAISIQNSGDVGGPTVAVSNLATGDVVSGDTVVNFTATPTTGNSLLDDSVQVRVDQDNWVTVDVEPVAAGGAGSDTLPAGNLADGVHTVRYRAKDSGSELWGYSELILFTVDNTRNRPGVVITAPSDSLVKSGIVTVTFTATPASGRSIDSAEITIDGVRWQRTTTATTHSWNSTLYPDGTHLIQVRATDSYGLTGYSQAIALLINNTPVVAIGNALADSIVSGTLVVPFTATPVAPATIVTREISIDGGAWRSTSTASTDTLDTSPLSEGTHLIRIRATDSGGRIGYSQIVSFVVRNAPSVAITAPRADSVVSGTLAILFTPTPVAPATIASTQISIDGGAWRATSSQTSDTLPTGVLTDGSHTIQVRAIDSNGKTGNSAIVKFELRNAPSVTLTAPKADSSISGLFTIRFSAAAIAPATIGKREIFIDGAVLDTASTDSSYIWNSTSYTDGHHAVQIKVTDSNGKTGMSSRVSVNVRNAPAVAVSSPVGGSVVSGIDTVKFSTVAVSPATIAKREVSIDGGAWTTTLVGDSTYIITTTDWADGTHSVQVRATDNKGHVGISEQVQFITRNEPSVTILLPAPGDTVSGTITVKFSASASAPATIKAREYSVDGEPFKAAATDSTALVETRKLADGSHVVAVRITDSRDRMIVSEKRLFVVDNAAPVAADPSVAYTDESTRAKAGSSVLVTVLVKDIIAGLRLDSGVVLSSTGIGTTTRYVMVDDGTNGDKVAGDNVYSALVAVNSNITGGIGYSVTATDRLGNAVTLVSKIELDNAAPVLSMRLEPEPEKATGKLHGETYFDKIVVKGTYSDAGGSGLDRVFVSVKNDSGKHVNSSPVVLATQDSVFSRIIELVPGKNTIMLYARDKAGNADSMVAIVEYLEPKATATIGVTGGQVKSPDNASVTIPANALLNPIEVTITEVDAIEQAKPLDPTLKLLNVAHDFGPDGTTFRVPVIVSLAYTEADLDKDQDGVRDVDPSKLTIVYWDGKDWQRVGKAAVDTVNRIVSVAVNHFTVFDLAEDVGAVPTKLLAYWMRNPVKYASNGADFVYNLPAAGKVSLHILDLAGDLVYRFERMNADAGQNRTRWRGVNVAEQFAGVGSYIYVFKYTNSTDNKTTIIRKPVGLLR